MPVYEVVLRQRYYNQETVNRWNYILTGTPAAVTGAFGLISAMGAISLSVGTLIAALRALQSDQVDFVDIEARNIYSTTDFYTRPFATSTNGQQSGEGMSPIQAYGFRTSRVRTDVRRGTKRFAGVSESLITSGGLLTETGLTAANALKDKMDDALSYDDEGNTLTYTPCVCGKEAYTTPSGKTAYRYYGTEASQLAHTASGVLWETYDTVRSQVSRQYGRGR